MTVTTSHEQEIYIGRERTSPVRWLPFLFSISTKMLTMDLFLRKTDITFYADEQEK